MAEAQASEMQLFSALVVPGILQSQRYAEACIKDGTTYHMTRAMVEQLLEVRMKRQWHILDQLNPPKIDVLLEESVLYRQLGGPQILKEQLRHLLILNTQNAITISVLPLSAANTLAWHAVTSALFITETHDSSVFFEDMMGAMVKDQTTAVTDYYMALFKQLSQKALSSTESNAMIQRAITWLDTTNALSPQLGSTSDI